MHFGGTFTQESVKALLEYVGVLKPYENIIELPKNCEITVKKKEGKTYIFVLNYVEESQEIFIKKAVKDMDTKEQIQGKICLEAYETKVYEV